MVDYCFLLRQAVALIAAIAYPWFAAEKDFFQIELNGKFDSLKAQWHKLNIEIRLIIFIPITALADKDDPLVGLAYLALVFAIHWLVFDYRLNTFRGLDPWYQGQNAGSDKFATKLNKLLALGLTLTLYLGACYWVLT
jgi:hypothetical protein